MGACSSEPSNTKNRNKNLAESNDTKGSEHTKAYIPESETLYRLKFDSDDLIPDVIPNKPLRFELLLSNFKVKGLSSDNYYFIELSIPLKNKKHQLEYLPITGGPNPKFNFKLKHVIELNFEELKTSYIKLYLYSFSKKSSFPTTSLNLFKDHLSYNSCILIDMMTIAVGPVHHDLKLIDSFSRAVIGRVTFDVICNHIEEISININYLNCTLDGNTSKNISCQLKFNDRSNHIDSLMVKLSSPTVIKGEDITSYKWFTNNNRKANDFIEITQLLFGFVEFRSSLLELCFYDTLFEMNQNSTTSQNPNNSPTHLQKSFQSKHNLLGSSYLNLYEILIHKEDEMEKQRSKIYYNSSNLYKFDSVVKKTQSIRLSKEKERGNENYMEDLDGEDAKEIVKFKIFDKLDYRFEETIYMGTSKIGKVVGKIVVDNIPLIRQIMCGVHTEKGLDTASAYLGLVNIYNLSNSSGDLPKEIIELNTHSKKLYSDIANTTSLTQVGKEGFSKEKEISATLDSILIVLKKTAKESMLFYAYNSETDIIKGQEVIVELGVRLTDFIESLNTVHRYKAFSIISIILERGELELDIYSRMINENVDNYEACCENFTSLLVKLLNFAIDNVQKGTSDEPTRKIIEQILAMAYYRIPQFQKVFLDICIQGWREEDNSFVSPELAKKLRLSAESTVANEEQKEQEMIITSYVGLIDWKNLFYGKFRNQPNSFIHEKNKEIDLILEQLEWREKLENKGKLFYMIIQNLDIYLQKRIVAMRDINWMYLPGFSIILNSIINQLVTLPCSKYPTQLIEVMSIFINKANIMNSFFSTIVSKTNVFDTKSVFVLFKVVDSFFQAYQAKKEISNFTLKFNYNLLEQAAHVIVENDHSLCVAKMIEFYYKNADNMNIEHLHKFIQTIIDRLFFKLFFHWSWQVRNIFYYTILFVINSKIRKMETVTESKSNERHNILKKKESTHHIPLLSKIQSNKMKEEILEVYDSKKKIIEKFKEIRVNYGLDPNYYCQIPTISELKDLTEDLLANFISAVKQFENVELFYKNWETECKMKKEVKYPVIDIAPPRDDNVEYSSEN